MVFLSMSNFVYLCMNGILDSVPYFTPLVYHTHQTSPRPYGCLNEQSLLNEIYPVAGCVTAVPPGIACVHAFPFTLHLGHPLQPLHRLPFTKQRKAVTNPSKDFLRARQKGACRRHASRQRQKGPNSWHCVAQRSFSHASSPSNTLTPRAGRRSMPAVCTLFDYLLFFRSHSLWALAASVCCMMPLQPCGEHTRRTRYRRGSGGVKIEGSRLVVLLALPT